MKKLFVDGLYTITPFVEFRNTPSVKFHILPENKIPRIDSVDRVEHGPNAVSPTIKGSTGRYWYYHKAQTDNLLVFLGLRITELYTPKHGKVETIEVTAECIRHNGEVVIDTPAILSWPPGVFHRVSSGQEGSLSLNFAVHEPGFSLEDNFDIYEVDTETGRYSVIRHGFLDQK
ncbi:hypothetical protein [Candidatus Magnetomonas plexicatena]|uniref:hypothetical protein n=1 Tax=Candidatus Magnetomonas plexicatena TaxID=2552947 RepID=UPI001101A46F|nr:hypothetical protein E2O03_014005 [Nitrospirales bacterium LBB_01]